MTKANFDAALDFVLRFEGGYVDHPSDPGGATNLGITRAALGQWRGGPVTKEDVRALSRTEAAAIYRARYWNAVRGDDLPAGLDVALFDLAVNSGPSRAIRLLQRAMGRKEDGRLGPSLLAAAMEAGPRPLIASLCAARGAFVKSLPTFAVFGRGWMARIHALEREALAMAASKAPQTPRSSQEKTMAASPALETTKSILASRTLWANAVGLLALGLSTFGFNTTGLDSSALAENLFQGVSAASFVASSIFRVLATRRLT